MSDAAAPAVGDRIAEVYADGWARIVATLIRFTGGDWDLAEECAQEAFATALRVRPSSGLPDQPLAWLTTTARRKAIDRPARRVPPPARGPRRPAATFRPGTGGGGRLPRGARPGAHRSGTPLPSPALVGRRPSAARELVNAGASTTRTSRRD